MYTNFLAPIHEYTNVAFRILCQRYGAKATCIPLINAIAIAHNPKKLTVIDAQEEEKNLGIQLIGDNPKIIGSACKRIAKSLLCCITQRRKMATATHLFSPIVFQFT